MRKLSLSILFSFIALCFSPVVLAQVTYDEALEQFNSIAAEESIYNTQMCPFGVPYFADEDAADVQSRISEVEQLLEQGIANSRNGKNGKANSCGDENPYTNFIEKGDCTAEGKVITEISETFGTDVQLDDGSEVITLYKGACCFAGELDENGNVASCTEVRDIYTDDFETCRTSSSVKCELRQWVISTTGTGVIKIYVKFIYTWGAGVVGFIAVAVMIGSAIQIQVSGVSGDISAARNRIIQSIAGLVLLFLSGLILYTINPTFFS